MDENSVKCQKLVGKWISVIYRQFQIDMNKLLKPYDLNSSQYIFLAELLKHDCVSQECLANILHIDKSATARAIKQLEDNGYVTRRINTEDKRSNYVCLTEKSYKVKDELFEMFFNWNRELTKSLSDEDYELVYGFLNQMAEDILKK